MFVEGIRTVRLGIKSLMLHKLRSALTTLGLLFGVSSVVAMLAIGEGGSQAAQDEIKALGSTNILIRTIKPPSTDENVSVWSAQRYGLTYRDYERMAKTLPAVEIAVPVRETSVNVRSGEFWFPGVVVGTTPDFAKVVGMRIEEGRWFGQMDLEKSNNVAVLGAEAARKLFPLTQPIGQVLNVSSNRFVVVGVFEYLGRASGAMGPSYDEAVFIPMTTSRAWWGDLRMKRSGGAMEITQIELHELKLRVREPELVIDTAKTVRQVLSDEHGEKDYSVTVPLELLRQAQEQHRIWSIVLASIAGISLLVGGIGIMNVMLATVTERTREIGIRRALGAKKRNVVSQFLVETLVLSCCGGLLGVLLGVYIPSLVEMFTDLKTLVKPAHPIMAFSISALVGVVFGLYPAWRAASMDPVEALRHE